MVYTQCILYQWLELLSISLISQSWVPLYNYYSRMALIWFTMLVCLIKIIQENVVPRLWAGCLVISFRIDECWPQQDNILVPMPWIYYQSSMCKGNVAHSHVIILVLYSAMYTRSINQKVVEGEKTANEPHIRCVEQSPNKNWPSRTSRAPCTCGGRRQSKHVVQIWPRGWRGQLQLPADVMIDQAARMTHGHRCQSLVYFCGSC